MTDLVDQGKVVVASFKRLAAACNGGGEKDCTSLFRLFPLRIVQRQTLPTDRPVPTLSSLVAIVQRSKLFMSILVRQVMMNALFEFQSELEATSPPSQLNSWLVMPTPWLQPIRWGMFPGFGQSGQAHSLAPTNQVRLVSWLRPIRLGLLPGTNQSGEAYFLASTNQVRSTPRHQPMRWGLFPGIG